MRAQRFRQDAFSLVELLVVIGIIALLIGIVMPAMSKARQQAWLVQCKNNMRQIGMGFSMYCDQNQGRLPDPGDDGDAGSPILEADRQGWHSDMLWINAVSQATLGHTYSDFQEHRPGCGRVPIDGDHHVLVCPQAPPASEVAGAAAQDQDAVVGGYFMMYGYLNNGGTLAVEQRQTFICYAMNQKLFGSGNPQGRMSRLSPSSEVVLVFEKRTNIGEATQADDDYYASVGGKAGAVLTATLGRFKGDYKRLSTRHYNGGNILFADGHVDQRTLHEVLTPQPNTTNWNKPGSTIWCLTGPG